MSNFFFHLNLQTNSNSSFSLITIPGLVELAHQKNLVCLAINDFFPYQVCLFFDLCKEKKIKPVLGFKFFGTLKNNDRRLLVSAYPKNNSGYRDVFKTLFSHSSSFERVFSLEEVFPLLKENCLLVFETSKIEDLHYFADLLTLPLFENNKARNIFLGINFFLLSPFQNIPEKLHDVIIPFYSIKAKDQQDKETLQSLNKTAFANSFFSEDRFCSFFSYSEFEGSLFNCCTNDHFFFRLLITNLKAFVSRINLVPKTLFPKKTLKDRTKANLELEERASLALSKLPNISENQKKLYQEVLEKELGVISELGYSDYFLILSDIVNYFQEKKVIYFGRGSSVSSLVAFVLKITAVDPLKHQLHFERFLNKHRQIPPDIDLDVWDQKEVFNYIFSKYPSKKVARLIVRRKVGFRLALNEAIRLFELEAGEFKKLTARCELENFEEHLRPWKLRFPELFAFVEKVCDFNYDHYFHPSGLIINNAPFPTLVPLVKQEESLAILWDKKHLQPLGLKKYDFISLKGSLDWLVLVREELNEELPPYDKLPLNDKKTWFLLNNLLTTGIFHFDTPSAKNLFNKLRPQNFSELVIILALNRPGTIKKTDQLIKNKNFPFLTPFFSEAIKNILANTYYCVIFEEQISQLLALIHRVSFAEAERKRREMSGSFISYEEFLNLVEKVEQIDPRDREVLYKAISSSLEYTFNKAHSVSYSFLAYYCAYLKSHYFDRLIATFLTRHPEKLFAYLGEAFFLGYEIFLPEINSSQLDWTVQNSEVTKQKSLFMGFHSLNNFQEGFFLGVLEERKKSAFLDWEDFAFRTAKLWDKIEISIFCSWIKIGLFDSLKVSRSSLFKRSEQILLFFRLKKSLPKSQNKDLPFVKFNFSSRLGAENSLDTASINLQEKEILGEPISFFSRWSKVANADKEVLIFSDFLRSLERYYYFEKKDDERKKQIKVYAVLFSLREALFSDSRVLCLRDVKSTFEATIEKKLYQRHKSNLIEKKELLITLSIEFKNKKLIDVVCLAIEEFNFLNK